MISSPCLGHLHSEHQSRRARHHRLEIETGVRTGEDGASQQYLVENRRTPASRGKTLEHQAISACHLREQDSNARIGQVPCLTSLSYHRSMFSRQNQANELLRIQQSSVEREHEIAEDFRSKLSHIKREINQMKKVHDDRSAHLNQEHQDAIERLRDEHQLEFDKLKGDMRAAFDIESHAQKNFYVQTIEQLKREQHELLARVNTQQSTDHVLEEQYHRDKQQLEKQTRMLEEQIERVQEKSQAESLELNNQLDAQRSQYQQLHDDYEQYKSIFNAKSDHVTEMNEQVGDGEGR